VNRLLLLTGQQRCLIGGGQDPSSCPIRQWIEKKLIRRWDSEREPWSSYRILL